MEVASPLGFEEESSPAIDFSTNPEVVRAVAEGFRLGYGYLFNPAFATEISLIDPLPHQRIAVYDHMLPQPRLHFLLADEPGGGKTIMAGLYIREMLARRLIRRILVVPPAGLIGNWERELRTLFSLDFHIIGGSDSKADNPFRGPNSDRLIVSVDTLAGERTFARLQEQGVEPYDLCIFDESHKLSADRQPDFSIRRTDRYRVAEALAGVPGGDPRWSLDWSSHHMLLLTATPHMGKDFPRARILNRSAARLAMSIFQRRLASSTYAMMRSFERRLEKLKGLIESIQTGKITVDQLTQMQRKLDETKDVLDEETGDEESPKEGKEGNELTEHKAMGGVVAVSLTELIAEQQHDPIIIINLIAGKTREGRVMMTLLDKLERIRKELGNDKVFDVIGRLFEGVSIKQYMEQAVSEEGAEEAVRGLEGVLTKEQVEALEARERRLYGDGGDVKAVLASEREKLQREGWRRLLPGYVRRFIEKSAPFLNLGMEGDLDGTFALKPLAPGAPGCLGTPGQEPCR
ncbi:MAG: DEAD/DEAH box helicase family protein [Isosphaerales bacterium]